jgi:S-formylglutathione hydrolase FrmB
MKLRRRMSFDPDATAMFELRSDGVPVEIAGGKTDEIPAYGVGAASPRFVVLSVWAMVLALTLYGAKDLRALVQYDESLAGYSVLLKVVEGIHSLASTLGATDAKDALDDVFLPIKTKVPDESELVAAMDVTQGNPAEGSAAAPARVLLVGASSIEFYMGTELERRLELYDGVTVHRFGKLGTGLARPDNFDWPKQLTKLLANYRPHLVIAQFGGNDSQPLEADGGMVQPGTPEWDADYTQRVKRVAAQVQASGAKMIMLGMPITRHRKHSDRLRQVNVVTRAAAEAAGATYIPTWDIAADERAEPRTQMTHDGKTGPMYLPDGVHLGRVGAAYVAQRIAWRLERLLVMTPSDRALAAVKPLDVDSKATGRSAHYLAFVPQGLKPDTKLPVLYLLHGADASSEAFSENAHDLLQRLAAKYQLVLVAPDADPHGWYLDSGEIPKSNSETFIIEELLPDVERRLPVSTRRGVAGISMGGNGAVMLSLKHPKTFVAASSMSGAVDLSQATDRPALIERLGPFEQNKDAWLGNSALQLVRKNGPAARALPVLLTVGAEDKWVPANRALAAALREAGAVHELREVPGGHTWAVWVAALPAHVEWHSLKLGEGSAAR